jgi:hypothetical protein
LLLLFACGACELTGANSVCGGGKVTVVSLRTNDIFSTDIHNLCRGFCKSDAAIVNENLLPAKVRVNKQGSFIKKTHKSSRRFTRFSLGFRYPLARWFKGVLFKNAPAFF